MAGDVLRLGGVPEHFNLPWHLALESGVLADMTVEWTDQLGGTGEMLSGLEDGSLDVVSILTEGTVSAIADGLDAVILQVYVSSSLQWGVFVPASSDLTSEDELEGRPVAISRFRSGSHLMAFVLAERKGWKLNEDQFVVTGGLDGAREAFGAGDAEVFLWDRFMTQPLVDAGEFRRVGVAPTSWPSFVVAASLKALTGRTTDVGRVVDAVVAEATSLHDRVGVQGEIESRYGLRPNVAAEWLATTSFGARAPFDPAIGDEVLSTLTAAGFRRSGAA
jgi:ABC-type nitrate/sulfonate/bicarbonate transport system substrate-binding protein